jgi:hypothetical protein
MVGLSAPYCQLAACLPARRLPARLLQVRGEKMELGCDSDTGGQVSGRWQTMLGCACLVTRCSIDNSGFPFAPPC